MHKDDSGWGLALLLIVSLALRVAMVSWDWESLTQDDDDYGRLATNLVTTGTYGYPIAGAEMRPTAYRPPAYPALLTLAALNGQIDYRVVALIHVSLGVITVLLVYWIAQRMQFRYPSVPALAVACDPLLLRGSQLIMTETLITFWAVVIWALFLILIRPTPWESGRRFLRIRIATFVAGMLGLSLGLAILTRPTMLPWAMIVLAALAVRPTPAGKTSSLLTTAAVCMLAVILPWTIRNHQLLGRPIVTTTHGGYTLLLANNPALYRHFESAGGSRDWNEDEFHQRWTRRREQDPRSARFWDEPLPAGSQANGSFDTPAIDELQDDRLASELAMQTIQSHPDVFAMSCLYRVAWLWSPYPNTPDARQQWSIGVWYSAWYFLAAISAIAMGRAWSSRAWLVPLMLLLTLTMIHAVYWSNMRMRSPIMPAVYMIACWPLTRARATQRFPT